MRPDGRAYDAMRAITIGCSPNRYAEGSALIRVGETHVLCTVSVQEDASADMDLNVVMDATGCFVEVQGTAESTAVSRDELDKLLNLASRGIENVISIQREVLACVGIVV